MSKNLNLWDNLNEINVIDFPAENVIKFGNVAEYLFILTDKHNLYYGNLENQEAEQYVQFRKASFSCLDIDSFLEYLYIIDANGCVYKCNKKLEVVEEIQLICLDNVSCCHGFVRKYKIKVKNIAVNDFGGLFITNNDQLWAFGNMPQINIASSVPKKVAFFSGRKVHHIDVGNDFAVVIASAQEIENEFKEYITVIEECTMCGNHLPNNNFSFVAQDKIDEVNLDGADSSNGSSCSLAENKTMETFEILKSVDNKNVAKNVIFRNTEAAKDFLIKKFSWISMSGDELLSPAVQTRAIKENVTNVASLVCETVKNVGDKVATLSKHLSNDSEEIETSLNVSNDCLPRMLSLDDISCSYSQLTSETMSENEVKESYTVLEQGADLINREVWTWGNIAHGQLGTGDNIKRERPMIISKLSNVGAIKCSVKSYHAVVLTLDGRAFLWGKNDKNQISIENNLDQSSPKLFSTPSNERIVDVSCGFYHTNLLSTNGDLYYLGSRKKEDKPVTMYSETIYRGIIDNLIIFDDIELIPVNEKGISNGKLFSSNQFTLFDKQYPKKELNTLIVEESGYLEDLLVIYSNIVKQIQKKYIVFTGEKIYEKLSTVYLELIYLVANNLSSITKYSYGEISNTETVIVRHYEEFLVIYKKYFDLINDIISIDGLPMLANLVDVPQVIYKIASINAIKNKGKNSLILLKTLLNYPMERFLFYEEMIHKLLFNGNSMLKNKILNRFTSLFEEEKDSEAIAETTKQFWVQSGKLLENLKTPQRKLILESQKNPIYLYGGSRFSSHWFILLSDIFLYVNGSAVQQFDLKTVWVEAIQDENDTEHKITLKTPEDFFTLVCYNLEEKSKWLQALQKAIKIALKKEYSVQVPAVRKADYTFRKFGFFKNSKYSGRWVNAEMHGKGTVEWMDGRKYSGQMNKSVICGFGQMEIPNSGVYEGSWKDNRQNGYGIFKYTNGDVYKGYFKDGIPHGHGCLQQGHFMSSTASVYVGEWIDGTKNGYGICDEIVTGEKYLGKWSDNKRHGKGIIVTSDGVYYEGVFNQGVLVGNGLMILEDGTHYEGDFKGIGQFNGRGKLTLNSGHTIIGQLSGSLTDGLKINNGMLRILNTSQNETSSVSKDFGKFCVSQDDKWIGLFRHCYHDLGMSNISTKTVDTQKIWQNVAARLFNSYRNGVKKEQEQWRNSNMHSLDMIPKFGMEKIDERSFNEIKNYLTKAFDYPHHPLHSLLNDVTTAYNTSYGGLRAHPLLLKHAVLELHSILRRIYEIILFMFPALPQYKEQTVLGKDDSEIASYQTLLHPIILPKVHSSLFVLYTLHNNAQDLQYWKRLVEWNKQPDYSLMVFLSVDKRFFERRNSDSLLSTSNKDETFLEPIETLQLIKTTFSPFEKILVIKKTFQKTTDVVQNHLGDDYKWSMDDLFPVFMYIVVRARILQLGAEIHFIEDFVEFDLENGELGIMFTILKACYQQILQEKATIN